MSCSHTDETPRVLLHRVREETRHISKNVTRPNWFVLRVPIPKHASIFEGGACAGHRAIRLRY
jgi:hypothetical protein